MVKTTCIVCTKNLGWSDIGYVMESLERSKKLIPDDMRCGDKVCNKCFNEIQTIENKEKVEPNKMKSQRCQQLTDRVPQYKPNWDKGGVIEYKDEFCALLHRSVSAQVEFIIAFSDLTKEGYRLMTQDECISGSNGEIRGSLNSYFTTSRT